MKPTKPTRANKFWKTAERCKEIVNTWPKWKQNIVISAESASTGRFIRELRRGNK